MILCHKIVKRPCVSTAFCANALFLPLISCACVRRSLPGVKALCAKLLNAVRVSMPPPCCVSAGPIRLSSCGCGLACYRALPTCAFFLRHCLFSAEPDQLPHVAPWKGLWQWLAWLTLRHVSLHERDGFPRAQTRRPACWVICLRACPAPRVAEFLFRASVPPY
jgi:hypothetical protein